MRLIQLGQGLHTGIWSAAVARHPQVTPVAAVATGEKSLNLPAFEGLDSALKQVQADTVLVSGNAAGECAVDALNKGLAVILADPDLLTGAQLHRLRQAANQAGQLCVWPQPYRYARCEQVLRRYLESGRLGSIGHVSCTDARDLVLGQQADAPAQQWFALGAGHLEGVSRLFRMTPTTVMARFSGVQGQSATEAFLELQDQVRVQYFGSTNTGASEHSLWIEGAEGSLRTDDRTVWWRKRGWRFFAPIHFSFRIASQSYADLVDRALAQLQGASAQGTGPWMGIALAAAGWESAQRGASLDINSLAGESSQ